MDCKVLIISGGIGAGKSLCSRLLEKHGVPVFDCDSRTKLLYKSSPELAALVTEDLFTNPEALQRLENALFPVLMQDFREWAQAQNRTLVGFESATVLSKPFFDTFGDCILEVTAPEELRRRRVLERGGISEESLNQRLALQKAAPRNIAGRSLVEIRNDSSVENTEQQIINFLEYYGNREN